MKPSDRKLWVALGVVAGVFLIHGLVEQRESFLFSHLGLKVLDLCVGFSLTRIDLVVGFVLALLTFLGFLLRWGPLVPCTFLGVCSLELLASLGADCAAYEASVAYTRAIDNDIGVLFLGAICGAGVGLALDCLRCPSP
jgi:hypothetical protein